MLDDTSLPLNLDTSDLSRIEWRTREPYPLEVLTDTSFEIAQCTFAAQVRRALDELVLRSGNFSYDAVLDQDREFQQVLDVLPRGFSEQCSPLTSPRHRYQRSLLHERIYARLVRLHRPFLCRGYEPDSAFAYSTRQCLRAARLILASNLELIRTVNSEWWMYTATFSAAIVLFMDLFHAIDQDLPELVVQEKRENLQQSACIFNTDVISPALQAVVLRGRQIISGLFRAERERSTANAAHALVLASGTPVTFESFAHVLTRISREVVMESEVPPSWTDAKGKTKDPDIPDAHTDQSNSAGVCDTRDLSGFGCWEGGLEGSPLPDLSFFDMLQSEDWTSSGFVTDM